jgi:subtilase family serine protease
MQKIQPHGRVPTESESQPKGIDVIQAQKAQKKIPPVTFNAISPPPASALTPTQIRAAYNIPSNVTGVGAKIAIIDIQPLVGYNQTKILSDYNAFCTQFNLPTTGLNIYTYPPTKNSNPINSHCWGLEACLDIQWAHAVAPDANIMLILVANPAAQTVSGIAAAVNYAVSLGANIVSMSFGMKEPISELSMGFEQVFQNTKFVNNNGNNIKSLSSQSSQSSFPSQENINALAKLTLSETEKLKKLCADMKLVKIKK